MINYIVGKITYVGKKFILLESNWIGYYIHVTKPEEYEVNVTKRIYLSEILKLNNRNVLSKEYYGFLDLNSKYLFNLLQSVANIGPKTALSILKNDPKKIIQYIQTNNYDKLSCLPGISLQLAQAICHNLSKTINAKWKQEMMTNEDEKSQPTNSELTESEINWNEISSALLKLGYQRHDIEWVVSKLASDQENKVKDVSDALSICIQLIYQRHQKDDQVLNQTS